MPAALNCKTSPVRSLKVPGRPALTLQAAAIRLANATPEPWLKKVMLPALGQLRRAGRRGCVDGSIVQGLEPNLALTQLFHQVDQVAPK